MDFLRQKSVFFLRKYFDVPHAIGVLGRTFVDPLLLSSLKEVVCSEPSRNGSCAYVWGTSGARCPYGDVFLRVRASEAKRRSFYCSAFTSVLVFFCVTFVLIEGYFLRAYFSATIQTFQKETQLDGLSNRVQTFRKFSTGAILLASKARNF